MCLPELRVVNINNAAPKLGLGQVFFPGTEMLSVKRGKLRCHPGLGMNTVCNTRNRHFVDRDARPHIFPERPSHFAVQFAHAIRVPAETQRQDGHAKRIVRIQARVAE